MATAGADGIYRTDPILKRASYTQPTEETPDWSGWEAWMQSHKDQIFEIVGGAIGEITAPLEKRIKTLEMQLAAANGALDVLRGKGVPGCFHVKGTYNAKSVYNYLDVVAFDGASWVAKHDNPGNVPGPGWQLMACQGKRGVAGERGPAGPAGIPPRFIGACFNREGMQIQTSSGPISLFKSVSVDAGNFTLKFIASDDSSLSISLLPLFEAYHQQTSD